MPTPIILLILVAYFALLLLVSYFTSRKADNQSFFRANQSAPWYLVAFGMIGTSLSGVTFISVPGTVGVAGLSYFGVVLGYFIGYFVVAFVLLPLYYRLNLTSIYNYLDDRFGRRSYQSGAVFFIVSRTLGATLRLYLVINVLQLFVLDAMGIPFGVTSVVILLMILLYTFKGGVKTIVWTDTLQTLFMLLALVVCVGYIMDDLQLGIGSTIAAMDARGYLEMWNLDPEQKSFFLKQIIGGAFITITMTGLDQEMMQKNISVRTLADSQKNMVSFSVVLVFVNLLFLLLGGLLYLYADANQLTAANDDLFPTIAMHHLPGVVSLIFIIGLISALFPSADGAITALTASFCIDLIGIERNSSWDEAKRMRIRRTVHLAFAALFLVMVFVFKWIDNKSIIGILLDIASYTYGPLLGLFAFGILTTHRLRDKLVPVVCIIAPMLTYLLNTFSNRLVGSYTFGLELLLINGVLVFVGLWLARERSTTAAQIHLK